MSLQSYIELVELQRENYPRYPKFHSSNPLLYFPNRTAVEVATELLTFPSAYYVNTIQVGNALYEDVEDFTYYEFIVTSLVTNGTLSDWLYFYIPVSFSDPSVLINGQPFIDQITLPYFNHYNTDRGIVEKVYPHKPFMFDLGRPSTYTFGEPLKSHRHPFGNHFIFTGNFYLKKNVNKYIYEYVDYQQVTDYSYVLFSSDIAPIGFFPLANRVLNNSFRDEPPANVGLPPYQLSWTGDTLPDFRFTGRITNDNFSDTHPWFEYRLYRNDLPADRYILPHVPTTMPLDYVKVFLGEDMGVNLPIQSGIQRIKYRQTSSNNNLVIYAP